MRKRILFTASVPIHIKAFHLPYLKWFQEQGYETHVACNGVEDLPYIDKMWQVDFERSPYHLGNVKAYRQLKNILKETYFELITCHTPMASIITRLAAIPFRAAGTKVLYTAHGFHFFKGAPLFNWLTFYPMELIMSRYADAIITINKDDFEIISAKGSSKTKYYLIPGIGVDKKRFCPVGDEEKLQLRKKHDIDSSVKVLIYAAEFIPRKNHQFIIQAVAKKRAVFEGKKILFAGRGVLEEKLRALVSELQLDDIIKFVGFRRDIEEFYQLADIGISASRQEGLGLNLVEEMMCGLPIIATVDRGHKEIVSHGKNGFLYPQNDFSKFASCVDTISNNQTLARSMADCAIQSSKKFELSNSLKEMVAIYREFLS